MAADIEAIGGVAGAEPASGASAHAPDPASCPRAPAAPHRAAEGAVRAASSEVGLVFEVDRESHELVIKIVDRETHKVLREIPPEEFQQLRAAMRSVVGALLDRTG